jgi:hypothetical protein
MTGPLQTGAQCFLSSQRGSVIAERRLLQRVWVRIDGHDAHVPQRKRRS